MTRKKPATPTSTSGAFVNWEGIARLLGQPIENVEQVRRMELEPSPASPVSTKR